MHRQHALHYRIIAPSSIPAFLQPLALFWEPILSVESDEKLVLAEWHLKSEVDLAKIRQRIQTSFTQGLTIGLAPAQEIKAMFFDMDATVIVEESLVEIAKFIGKFAKVQEITERAMAGHLDFSAALKERVALLRGTSADVLGKVLTQLTLNRGIARLVALCKSYQIPTFMVSGGFSVLANPIGHQIGFTGIHANTLGIKDGFLTGEVEGPIIDAEGKKKYLLATCQKMGIAPQDVVAVGDGANDSAMLAAAGIAVGFCPKPALHPIIDMQNQTGDHFFLASLIFGSPKVD